MKKEPFYAAPGADDTFLRPPLGHGYASRQVTICAQGQRAWLSWIHRLPGKDVLVVTSKTPRSEARLVRLPAPGQAIYSKPALLARRPSQPPDVFCAVTGRNRETRIHHYMVQNGKWRLADRIRSKCRAIYHTDAIAAADGSIHVAYSGLAGRARRLQVHSMTRRGGRWEAERAHAFEGAFVNRPRLVAAGADDDVVLVADAYLNAKYDVFCKALDARAPDSWQRVSREPDWNLFPSAVRDGEGTLWVSWLRQVPVRRGDVMGLHQEARVARLRGVRWEPVPSSDGGAAADLNLGLLPIREYFGYDGLRRYPRLMAMQDGSVWLIWEQQKDEKEIWQNLFNGFLCGRRYGRGRWSRPAILADGGTCYVHDEKSLHAPEAVFVGTKCGHRKSGDDFWVMRVDTTRATSYSAKPRRLWRGWRSQALPLPSCRKRTTVQCSGRRCRLYWGDLHGHSVFSPDAEGEPDELYHFARDLAKLDFVAVTDNDFYPSKALLDSEVDHVGEWADALTRRGEFLALSGFEWTFHRLDAASNFNHRIVVFKGRDRHVVRRNERGGATENAFRRYLERHDHLVFPHHASWRFLKPQRERSAEVTAGWGPYILDADTIPDALNAGHKFGFLGNGDSHRFMPGLSGALTGVYARELSRPALFEAIRQRRCFATTGNRTAVAFWVNDAFMGGQVKTTDAARIRWRVVPETALDHVTLMRNGRTIRRSGRESGSWTDRNLPSGTHWYYLQVKEKGLHKRYPHNIAPAWGKYAWSSPIWVTVPG